MEWLKNTPANAGDIRDAGSIPGLGASPGEGNGYSLQYSGRENSMDRGAWQAIVHGVAKSQTQLSQFHFHVIIVNMLKSNTVHYKNVWWRT